MAFMTLLHSLEMAAIIASQKAWILFSHTVGLSVCHALSVEGALSFEYEIAGLVHLEPRIAT